MPDRDEALIVVVGPTATGKSLLAVHLARALGGEIVNIDSAQVYRGLDAATGKPPRDLRDEIPHHLIDVADPARDFSAGDFARLASAAIETIRARGRRPILAGGTGLYLTALLRGLAEMPRRDPDLRRALHGWASARDERALHRMLEVLDPPAAARIAPRDTQRIVRAIEVALTSGRTRTEWIGRGPFGSERYVSVKVGLAMPFELLTPRIDARVEAFFAAGLVEEVRALLRSGVPREANALKALGYRETMRHLEGEMDLPAAAALVKANTRRYARRQLTWFRREPAVMWFQLGAVPEERFPEIVSEVARRLDAPRE